MGTAMLCLANSHRRVLLLVVVTVVVLLTMVNWRIAQFEQLLQDGKVVRFALAPVDPRSIMQGDYMALEYAIAQEVRAALPEGMTLGQLLLTLDSQKVAHFVGIYRDQPKAADQLTVDFRLRNHRVKLASNSFFFEEGQADHFSQAKYGEFRVSERGELLLVTLLDEQLQPL